jgi:hypothetical protein
VSEPVPEQPAPSHASDGAPEADGSRSRALTPSALRSATPVLPGGGEEERAIGTEVRWVQRRETHWRTLARRDRLVPAALLPAVAAGSFAAGAALARLVQRWRMHTVSGGGRGLGKLRRGAGDGTSDSLRIVASRSLLVHVHVLGQPEK